MGQYKEIKGDMLEMFDKGNFHIIAHGCNCYATFGAGIALTIGNKYPEAMEADRKNPTKKGLPRLGNYTKADRFIQIANRTIGQTIYNLYTQLNPGRDFRMTAFKRAIKKMRGDIFGNLDGWEPGEVKIGLPLIGCGIAGGNWDEVSKVIQKELADFNVTVVHFDQKVIGVNYWPKKKKVSNDGLFR